MGSIFDWARREFDEEISYKGSFSIKPLGILNDDSNEVGKVHVGIVLLLKGDSSAISIRSELKSGKLITKQECLAMKDRMETWSQMIIGQLQ
jgi:predicted NUDIX family phosphoesterase